MNKENIQELLNELKKNLEVQMFDSMKLFYLLEEKDFESFKNLINKEKVNTKVRNSDGLTLLHCATNFDHLKLLLNTPAKDLINDQYNKKKETPLHTLRYKYNNIELTKLLIEAGADVNIKDTFQKAPLHYVKPKETIQLLLDAGADLNIQDYCGKTPLHYVKPKETIQLLLDAGADLNIQDCCGNTPLHNIDEVYYIDKSQSQLKLKLLLDAGADLNLKNNKGETPIDYYNLYNKHLLQIVEEYKMNKEKN